MIGSIIIDDTKPSMPNLRKIPCIDTYNETIFKKEREKKDKYYVPQ